MINGQTAGLVISADRDSTAPLQRRGSGMPAIHPIMMNACAGAKRLLGVNSGSVLVAPVAGHKRIRHVVHRKVVVRLGDLGLDAAAPADRVPAHGGAARLSNKSRPGFADLQGRKAQGGTVIEIVEKIILNQVVKSVDVESGERAEPKRVVHDVRVVRHNRWVDLIFFGASFWQPHIFGPGAMQDGVVLEYEVRTPRGAVVLAQAEGCAEKGDAIDRQVVAGAVGREPPVASLIFKDSFRRALSIRGEEIQFLLCRIVKPFARRIEELPHPKKIEAIALIPLSGDSPLVGPVHVVSEILVVGHGV